MAWCPKCRNEYVEGITRCSDCNVDLVEELEEIKNLKYLNINGYPNPEELVHYLHEASFESAQLVHLDEEDVDAIAVDEKDYFDARLHLNIYLQNELENSGEYNDSDDYADGNDSESDDGIEESMADASTDVPLEDDGIKPADSQSAKDDTAGDDVSGAAEDGAESANPLHTGELINTSGKGSYVRYSYKYEDVKSSAYTLLVVGSIGLIALLCEIAGFYSIPIASHSKFLFYMVLGGIFVAFIISGFVSMMRATELKIEAEKEDALIEDILKWFKDNHSAEVIDSAIDTDVQDELLYFNRAEYIKEKIMHEYETADEDLVDSLIENIYSDLYENTQE